MQNKKPKLTIISPSLNTGEFLRETINSILSQSYNDFEYIIIDGGSTDETLDILRDYSQKHSQIRLISEEGCGYVEAFKKGLAMSRGEYIMNCSISDGYLDKNWFQKCVDMLDKDDEVSLVWGLQQYKNKEGLLGDWGDILCSQFYKAIPPQKTEFVYYWIVTYFVLPEQNFCVRRNIINECFPKYDNLEDQHRDTDPWLEFNYNFNTRGYLPYFIQAIANFARINEGRRSQKEEESGIIHSRFRNYTKKIRNYQRKIIFGIITHQYKNGRGELLPYKFYRFSVPKFIVRYGLTPTNIVVNLSRIGYLRYIKENLPGIYQIGRKIFHKKVL
jgi:glycosyltransferase involved in cell wall biosynthesis